VSGAVCAAVATALAGLASSVPLRAPAADAPPRPNIVVLLCDDLGYGDLGCFGHPVIRTPNLDRLAAEGLKLTACYSAAPVCSPSRAGMMTGRTPNRLGIRDWIPGGSGIHLRPGEVTVAQVLRRAGYRTCHAGKWHLNSRVDGTEPTPGDAGFEHGLYTQNNASPGHLDPTNFIRNGRPAGPMKGPSSHLVVAEALRWLDGVTNEPFFLNLWFHEPHEPVVAADEFLAMYPDEPDIDRRHYYGDVSQMDAAVGILMKALDDRGLRERTFVFFSSDNGPETPGRYKGAHRSHGSPGPLRGMKLHVTEAGYRVPGILRWPGRTKPGAVSDEPVSSVDLLPTFCALAGVEPPRDRPLDGASLLPLFEGRPIARPRPLYWQYDFALGPPWQVALRDGAWKLLADGALGQFALHRIADDIGETNDLAAAEPARVRDMAGLMKRLHGEVSAEGAGSGNPAPRQGAAGRAAGGKSK
jgi:arylsulfatase A